MSAVSSRTTAGTRAWVTLALLGGLYFVSFVDRVILGLLVQPLKADLHVSDVQIGLLFGPAFATFYALVGLPMARIADRGVRLPLIVIGGTAWGLCTVASGFVDTYAMLVLLRVGLAIGEAALTPAVYSLIGTMFPAEARVRAASIYSAIGVAGGAGAYILGAAVIQVVGGHTLGLEGLGVTFQPWQTALIAVGLPAIAGALLVGLVGRDTGRAAPAGARPHASVWRLLRIDGRMYAPLFLGAGVLQAVNAAFAAWGPEYLRRDLHWAIRNAGLAFGLTGLVGAAAGVLLVPALGREWQRRGKGDAIALVAIAAGALGGLAAILAPLASGATAFLGLNVLAAFGLYGSSTGLVVAMQIIAPLRSRATLVAILILSITFFGQGLGPPAVAWAGQALGRGLGPSLSLVSLAAVLPGLLLLWAARRPLSGYLARMAAEPGPAE